jgi:nucleotide-binding universal stress UspA family protein
MPRFTNVVCGIDLSSADVQVAAEAVSGASAAALDDAVRIARDDGARLHLLTALDLDAAARFVIQRERKAGRRTVVELAGARLEELAAPARAAGIETTTAVAADPPAAALLADARAAARDLVVVGTRERGAIARNLLGSTALTLLRRAPGAVWVARRQVFGPSASVLAAIDLGDMAERVVAAAARIARRTGGPLHVLHVVDFAAEEVLRIGAADLRFVTEYRAMKRQRAETEVPALVGRAAGADAKAIIHLPDGDVAATILRAATDYKADFVVLSSVVHGLLSSAVDGLGRTAEKVLPQIQASLLVLRPQATAQSVPAAAAPRA